MPSYIRYIRLPSTPRPPQPLGNQKGREYDHCGGEPRWQAVAIQVDECANQPGSKDYGAINEEAVDTHGPGETCPRST